MGLFTESDFIAFVRFSNGTMTPERSYTIVHWLLYYMLLYYMFIFILYVYLLMFINQNEGHRWMARNILNYEISKTSINNNYSLDVSSL